MKDIHSSHRYFSLVSPAWLVQNPPHMTNPKPCSTLLGTDGVTIAYRERRVAGRPVVALLHSLGMDHTFWSAVDGQLGEHASVVAMDVRGHGQTGLGATPLDARRVALDLREVLDHLDIAQVMVAGASMGGCAALQFAIDHADRSMGLSLVDTTAWYGPTASADWESRAQKALTSGLSSMTDFQVTRWFSDDFRQREPAQVQRWIDVFVGNHIDGYVAACRMLGAFDVRDKLAGIRIPTLVQVGEEDYAAPVAMSRALHEAIAGSQLDVIQGARHLTPLEVPDRIANGLLQLIAQARP